MSGMDLLADAAKKADAERSDTEEAIADAATSSTKTTATTTSTFRSSRLQAREGRGVLRKSYRNYDDDDDSDDETSKTSTASAATAAAKKAKQSTPAAKRKPPTKSAAAVAATSNEAKREPVHKTNDPDTTIVPDEEHKTIIDIDDTAGKRLFFKNKQNLSLDQICVTLRNNNRHRRCELETKKKAEDVFWQRR